MDEINNKLNNFIKNNNVPNILFHGSHNSNKNDIVLNFINTIYNNNQKFINNYVMYVNCAHDKGIEFIRKNLKFFAKTHLNIDGSGHFKTIILSNAEKLTVDAQSALRRSIEIYSSNTRFFIIIEDKDKLLKPILSRFCEIYIPDNENILIDKNNKSSYIYSWIKREIKKIKNIEDIFKFSNKMYNKAYSALDLINAIEIDKSIDNERKYEIISIYYKVKRDFRNEKLLITYLLNLLLIRSENKLENISFM